MPKSNFHKEENSELERVFAGRVPVVKVGSYYLFEKSGKVQKLLHSIKYKSNKVLAEQLGVWYAQSLKDCNEISKADVIIPVPLHPKKQKQRGFNQSEEFVKGLSKELNIPINTTTLFRNAFTETQTRKKKFERWENVKDKFELKNPESLENKSVLLVDDVITTGATIDACYEAMKNVSGLKVSVLSLAYAKRE
ncbi:MAG: ComF family protein [Sphingobacteriaceae bacterium]|nr:ComF family protein [Sphingobacteriaceae bacterium]